MVRNKNDNFTKATKRLNEANTQYRKNPESDICRDALIKRFEFTFELAWKTLREYMISEGYSVDFVSPKKVLSLAYNENIIDNETLWLGMLADRNNTSHDYDMIMSDEIAHNISTKYAKELSRLNKFISEHTSN